MLKLGLNSFSYHLHLEDMDNPRDAFWFLRKTLELGLDGCYLDPRHLQGWNEDLVSQIGEFCRKQGLYLELGSGGFDFARIARRLTLAAQFDARLVRTFIGGERQKLPEGHREKLLQSATESFKRLAEVAKSAEVPLGIENHEDLTSEEVIAVLQAVDSPYVRAVVDNGNCFAVWEDPVECAEKLSPYMVGNHLKDSKYWWDEGVLQREGCALGLGDARVAEVYPILRKADPDMPVTLEVPTVGPYMTVKTLREEEHNVLQSIEYVRKLEHERS